MPELVPTPSPEDIPFNEPVTVTLSQGEQATVTFTPIQRTGTFYVPILAVSKFSEMSYTVRTDDMDRYGPASVPPTDIDNLGVTFVPALQFERTLEIQVTNIGSATRTVHVQPIGFEVSA